MSTNSQNINISQQNVQGKCDLKCSYNFTYQESNTTATNRESMIVLTYENSSVPPVLYNNQKYTVSGIMMVSPSIHTFNNTTAAAEIIIEHVPVTGGNALVVAIPIVSSSEGSTASTLIAEIIQSVSNNAPSPGDSTNLNISGFSLQDIVPKKPFYSYTNETTDWVVFGVLDAIPLSSSILTTLGQITKPFPIPTPGNALFYNSSGPNSSSSGVGDGIYISCQPTGSSEEETAVAYDKNSTSYDLSTMFNNPNVAIAFQVIIGCIVFIILFLILNFSYSYLTSTSTKLPSLSIPKIM